MNIKQNPFSLYDFLGYFTPGALFLYGLVVIVGHLSPDSAPLENLSEFLAFDRLELYIPFILVAYTLGHILSFISSITVERYSVWAFGYPSKYLLGLKSKGYYHTEKNREIRCVVRTLVWCLLLPVTLLDFLLGNKAHMRDLYAKPLDNLLINLLRTKIVLLLSDKGGVEDPAKHGKAVAHDYFRYVYHYAVENAPSHLTKMQNYVALYGFLRTITLLLVMIFWAFLIHFFTNIFSFWSGLSMVLVSAFVCYLSFMAFVKFYRRFSLEALMAMAVSYQNEPNNALQPTRKNTRG